MTHPELTQMHLNFAFLCADLRCSTISSDSRQCPRCGSQVLSLARVLERLAGNEEDRTEEAAA